MKRKKLGEVLRERGHITPDDLIRAIEGQQGTVTHLGELMLERGLVSKPDLAAALTEVTHVPYVDCEKLRIDAAVLKLVPHAQAKRCGALPIQLEGTTKLEMVMAEPQNLQIIDELRFSTGLEIIPGLAFRDEIERAIEKWYAAAGQADGGPSSSEDSETDVQFISPNSLRRNADAVQEMQTELLKQSTPAVRLVASVITAAANKQASDVHIEPQATDAVVRLRVDGILRDFQRIPRSIQSSFVSRIKILSDMDIAERKAPQDGRFAVKISGRRIDVRVSTLPTQYGEKVVMRLLEESSSLHDLGSLGFPGDVADSLRQLLSLPQGMILVTGPTRSGRSTTLRSLLDLVRKPSVNIVSVEDVVECVMPGVNQVKVNAKTGVSFASVLRSVLRQDPNVIVLDEIRDKETADIAMKASQTGHLVLSTLHTNDSAAAVTRLLDLAVPAPEIANCVTGIVAQRLIRLLCDCHKVIAASPEYVSRLKGAGVHNVPEMESVPVGCEICDLTGYKGRTGIFELLDLNDSVRAAIRSGARNEQIRSRAGQNGMRLLQEYALECVRAGTTTLEEVQRVIPFETKASKQCQGCAGEISSAFLFCPYCGEKVPQPLVPRSRKTSVVK
jgi:type IV pilus assembly protein PilB